MLPTKDRYTAVVSCMDGRFSVRTVQHVQARFGVRNVDTITTAGAVRHVANPESPKALALLDDLAIAVNVHQVRQVAIVAHEDCAGNPVPAETQKTQLRAARGQVEARFPDLEVVTLFLEPRTGFERIR